MPLIIRPKWETLGPGARHEGATNEVEDQSREVLRCPVMVKRVPLEEHRGEEASADSRISIYGKPLTDPATAPSWVSLLQEPVNGFSMLLGSGLLTQQDMGEVSGGGQRTCL